MKQTTKRKIASELVILFSCATLIGLTWIFFWTVNEFHISEAKKLEKKTLSLSHAIDSIQIVYSKSKLLQEILDDKKLPKEYFDKGRLPIILPPYALFDKIMALSTIQRDRYFNELRLILVLQKFKSPFDMDSIDPFIKYDGYSINPFGKLKEPVPFDTLQSISEKFKTDFPEKEKLKRIYDFLKTKNCINVNFKEFCFTMQGLPLPPSENAITIYKNDRKEFDKTSKDLINTKQSINSKEQIKEIIKWISIIILALVYPIRFLFLSLRWSLRTLRQVDNNK
jgi:hypothetical protein